MSNTPPLEAVVEVDEADRALGAPHGDGQHGAEVESGHALVAAEALVLRGVARPPGGRRSRASRRASVRLTLESASLHRLVVEVARRDDPALVEVLAGEEEEAPLRAASARSGCRAMRSKIAWGRRSSIMSETTGVEPPESRSTSSRAASAAGSPCRAAASAKRCGGAVQPRRAEAAGDRPPRGGPPWRGGRGRRALRGTRAARAPRGSGRRPRAGAASRGRRSRRCRCGCRGRRPSSPPRHGSKRQWSAERLRSSRRTSARVLRPRTTGAVARAGRRRGSRALVDEQGGRRAGGWLHRSILSRRFAWRSEQGLAADAVEVHDHAGFGPAPPAVAASRPLAEVRVADPVPDGEVAVHARGTASSGDSSRLVEEGRRPGAEALVGRRAPRRGGPRRSTRAAGTSARYGLAVADPSPRQPVGATHVGGGEALPRPGHRHVEEPPLLLEGLGAALAPGVGEESSSAPTTTTPSNSSPLAAWTVIRLTSGPSLQAPRPGRRRARSAPGTRGGRASGSARRARGRRPRARPRSPRGRARGRPPGPRGPRGSPSARRSQSRRGPTGERGRARGLAEEPEEGREAAAGPRAQRRAASAAARGLRAARPRAATRASRSARGVRGRPTPRRGTFTTRRNAASSRGFATSRA